MALFDLDNTLMDRQAAFHGWARHFVDDRGLGDPGFEAVCEWDEDGHATRQRLFDAVRDQFGLPDSTEELIADYRSSYPAFFLPDPAVNQALSALRTSGWRIGVATNGPPSQLEKLDRTGILPLLDGFCISDDFGWAKPDRRIFDEAVRRCSGSDGPPMTVWMVGDTPVPDIMGGAGAGLRTIWLHRGRQWEESGYRPDWVAGSIEEAVEYMLSR